MKRVIGLVFLCGAASCVAANAASPIKAKTTTASASAQHATGDRAAAKEAARAAAIALLAPADEYFGPLKMSIIGIRNTLRDLGLRYDVNHDIGRQTMGTAQLTERAIRDWEHRYPRDGQVPRAVFLLQRLYTKVLMQQARDRAHATAQWLLVDFRNSPQARQLKKTLAVERLAPLPPPTPDATPTPAYGSTFGAGYPSTFSTGASPVASPTPTPHG